MSVDISDCPLEILILIFDYFDIKRLSIISTICHRWKLAVQYIVNKRYTVYFPFQEEIVPPTDVNKTLKYIQEQESNFIYRKVDLPSEIWFCSAGLVNFHIQTTKHNVAGEVRKIIEHNNLNRDSIYSIFYNHGKDVGQLVYVVSGNIHPMLVIDLLPRKGKKYTFSKLKDNKQYQVRIKNHYLYNVRSYQDKMYIPSLGLYLYEGKRHKINSQKVCYIKGNCHGLFTLDNESEDVVMRDPLTFKGTVLSNLKYNLDKEYDLPSICDYEQGIILSNSESLQFYDLTQESVVRTFSRSGINHISGDTIKVRRISQQTFLYRGGEELLIQDLRQPKAFQVINKPNISYFKLQDWYVTLSSGFHGIYLDTVDLRYNRKTNHVGHFGFKDFSGNLYYKVHDHKVYAHGKSLNVHEHSDFLDVHKYPRI